MVIPWEKRIGVYNMGKYIYKITNKINGKSYIGQAFDYKKRWKEHINHKAYAIGAALELYGVENFDFSIIEYANNYNDREKYYIKYYNTFRNGYNLTLGGEDGQRPQYDYKEIEQIKILLKSQLTLAEISAKTRHSIGFLININYGRIYNDETETYPLSSTSMKLLTQEEVYFIEELIMDNPQWPLKRIAEKTGRSKSTIEKINHGKHNFSSERTFPVRKKNSQVTVEEFNQIVDVIKYTKYSQQEIANLFQRNFETINFINHGKHRLSHLYVAKYPIR